MAKKGRQTEMRRPVPRVLSPGARADLELLRAVENLEDTIGRTRTVERLRELARLVEHGGTWGGYLID